MNSKRINKADETSSAFLCPPDFSLEKDLLQKGYDLIAGIDEAGRGALAGPLSVAMVIYDSGTVKNPPYALCNIINDSKKLTHRQRVEALEIISHTALCVHVSFVAPPYIDKLNINGATDFAIRKCLKNISVKPDYLLIDGNFSFAFEVPSLPVKGGDGKSLSIASASIAAKVNRDLVMETLDIRFPYFGLKKNKGYGTKIHLDAIKQKGYTVIHRQSYEPVKSMISEMDGNEGSK